MIGVSKTFGGSSILSSPVLASAEKLGKSSLSAFFVLRNLRIWIITVYIPNTDKFEDDLRTRREH